MEEKNAYLVGNREREQGRCGQEYLTFKSPTSLRDPEGVTLPLTANRGKEGGSVKFWREEFYLAF